MPSGNLEEFKEEVSSTQVADLRATILRLQKRLAKEQDRSGAIRTAIYQAVHDGLVGVELPPVPTPTKDKRKKSGETAVMLVSDLQLGKRTPSYNSEVCAERMVRYAEKVGELTRLQRLDHPVKKAVIFLLGDIIEGELIFPGQAHEIDSSLYRQVTIDGPQIIGGLVRWAASEFEEVEVFAVPGNHGYLGGRARKDYMRESNGDRMLYQIVSMMTQDLENVTWTIAEDWYLTADLGPKAKFMLLHGDQVRGWAGVPWYGWTKKVLGWASMSALWEGMDFRYVAAGHFHTPTRMYLNGRTVWINASTESHNPYALEQLAAAGEPAQWLLFVKPDRGTTAEYLVQLDT